VHLAVIDVLFESQGSIIFNEIIPGENYSNPEFRFFNEEIVELNTSPEVLVMYGQTYNQLLQSKNKKQL